MATLLPAEKYLMTELAEGAHFRLNSPRIATATASTMRDREERCLAQRDVPDGQ